MEVSYQLTEQDFREGLATHRNKVTFRRWPFRIIAAIAILLVILGIAGFAANPGGNFLQNFFPLFVLISVWVALLWIAPILTARTQYRKQPAAQGSRTVTVDESGVRSRWNGGTAEVEWKNYYRLIEGKSVFLLYTSPVCFGMIPKRAFSPGDLDAFRALATSKIPRSA